MAKVTRPCSLCEAVYEGDSRSRYCSPECKQESARRRAAAWYVEHRDDPELRRRVKAATARHYERTKADPDEWAKKLARTAAWRMLNPDLMRTSNREWCAANRDRKRAKDHRRRARLLDAYVADVDPAVIWKRDKGICGICHEPIDPSLPWSDKMCRTLDHIVPLAKGGTHEPSNVQLAHAVCNSRKCDRLDVAA